jgi:hypothetical protein
VEVTPEPNRCSDGSDGAAEPPGGPETASPGPIPNRCAGHTRATAHSRGRRSYESQNSSDGRARGPTVEATARSIEVADEESGVARLRPKATIEPRQFGEPWLAT